MCSRSSENSIGVKHSVSAGNRREPAARGDPAARQTARSSRVAGAGRARRQVRPGMEVVGANREIARMRGAPLHGADLLGAERWPVCLF